MMHPTVPPSPLTRAAVVEALRSPLRTTRVVLAVTKRPDAVTYATDKGRLVVRDDGPCHFRSAEVDGKPQHDGPVDRGVAEVIRWALTSNAMPDGEVIPVRYGIDAVPGEDGCPVIVDLMPPAGGVARITTVPGEAVDVHARVARLNADFEREVDEHRPRGLAWRTDGRTWAWMAVDLPETAPDVVFQAVGRHYTAETADGLFVTARPRRAIGDANLPSLGVEDYVTVCVQRAPVGQHPGPGRPLMPTHRRPSVDLLGRLARYVRAQLADLDASGARGGA